MIEVVVPNITEVAVLIHSYESVTKPPSGSVATPEQVRVVAVVIPIDGEMLVMMVNSGTVESTKIEVEAVSLAP